MSTSSAPASSEVIASALAVCELLNLLCVDFQPRRLAEIHKLLSDSGGDPGSQSSVLRQLNTLRAAGWVIEQDGYWSIADEFVAVSTRWQRYIAARFQRLESDISRVKALAGIPADAPLSTLVPLPTPPVS